MSHVYLIGFMGAGKSTVGELLARRMGLPFVDLDAEIEREAGMPVRRIFETSGEEGFRAAEERALRAIAEQPRAVVACGGGIILREDNRHLLRASGTVVYLAVSAPEALARIGDVSGRPLLVGDAKGMATSILDARLSLYRVTAHHTVDTHGRSAEEVAEEVARALGSHDDLVIRVATDRPYEVVVGRDILSGLGSRVASLLQPSSAVVITDEIAGELFSATVEASLATAGVPISGVLTVQPGEVSKTWTRAGELLDELVASGLDRGGVIIALGGGVVGDLAGFVAAVYLRGVPVVQVPTTLLAQTDSAIGGKTAVDLTGGKNLAGAFWQPSLVLADTATLDTLPDAEWANGLAEVVKTALLAGEERLARLEETAPHLAVRDEAAVRDAVEMCVRHKAGVVSGDERDAGTRETLNLGHTLGHAIELLAGFVGIAHGEAVAEGLVFALELSHDVLGMPETVLGRVESLLEVLGVRRVDRRWSADEVREAMSRDKKGALGRPRFVLLEAPGRSTVMEVDEETLMRALLAWSRQERRRA
ncbi:MAG: 3-dehydroquinate synthase [Anaerosomatales bacterium]|nr:3-dehydroquinate synthase [Anaerosomatales bacterium]